MSGIKYVEPIKSVILILLIALSVTLTFSIWTYAPKYPTIEQSPTVDVSIAEKKEIKDIIKPYKVLFNFEQGLKGTFDPDEINQVIKAIKEWTITDIALVDTKFTKSKQVKYSQEMNRFTLYFHGEVPLPIYDVVLNAGASNYPEASFDRLVIGWHPENPTLKIDFINQEKGLRYTGEAKVEDYPSFNRNVLLPGKMYSDFTEINPGNPSFIAVPTNPVELISNTYYQDAQDGINPSRFRDVLFSDPIAVRRGQVTTSREEFQDDHAIMYIYSTKKVLSFFHPVAESKEPAIPSQLVKSTIEFVNEHGGWTDDYRFTYINSLARNIKFQLFVNGLPVHSDMTSTEIEQTWGNDRIFRYVRPYYTLDRPLHSEEKVIELPSGVEVAETIKHSKTVDFNTVEEIALGYFMKHDTELDTEQRLFILEPSWFYLIKGKWIRYSPEHLGGETIGLE